MACQAQKAQEHKIESLKRRCEELKHAEHVAKYPVIGLNKGLKEVFQKAQAVVLHPINVLLTGETGTGKEVVAQR